MENRSNKTQNREDMKLKDQKFELIRLRIQNGFYEREEILEKVVSEIYKYSNKKS